MAHEAALSVGLRARVPARGHRRSRGSAAPRWIFDKGRRRRTQILLHRRLERYDSADTTAGFVESTSAKPKDRIREARSVRRHASHRGPCGAAWKTATYSPDRRG